MPCSDYASPESRTSTAFGRRFGAEKFAESRQDLAFPKQGPMEPPGAGRPGMNGRRSARRAGRENETAATREAMEWQIGRRAGHALLIVNCRPVWTSSSRARGLRPIADPGQPTRGPGGDRTVTWRVCAPSLRVLWPRCGAGSPGTRKG